jgi:sulfite reductase (NADPH) flavoprotein alpha-component
MSAAVMIPDAAPFSPEQRAWLSGFFSGIVNVAGATAVGDGGVGAPPQHETNPAEGQEEFPWHDPALPMDERLKLAEGKPPARVMMAAMAQLDCGACGYLCETYSAAIADGAEKDLGKCTPGGTETKRKLKELVTTLTVNGGAPKSAAAKKPVADGHGSGQYTRDHPFPARLVQCAPLNKNGSAKDTRHVVFDLRNSGLTYKVGDALGLFPENSPVVVQHILEALHASGAEDVMGRDDHWVSLRQALLHERTITKPSDDLLALLASVATDATEKQALEKFAVEGMNEDDHRHVLDILHDYPSARPKPEPFAAALAPLQPRLYSISSSLLAHPNQVHLTVGLVRWTNMKGRRVDGVASTFMSDHIRPGQHVRVFVHPSPKFGLPKDKSAPVIMVGPGTGIAPFRAFLHERRVDKHPGKNWLFFGDQRAEQDFLYRDELAEMQLEGVLTRMDTAFSRDQAAKVYVQDRMVEHGAELWKWLSEGGHFYVCGDAKRMAKDVDAALKHVCTTHGGVDGEAYVAAMAKEGRYQRDVY